MTRETKVGLLVGLGIILLIGVIVSDHLSLVNDQSPADLTQFAPQSQRSMSTTQVDRSRSPLNSDRGSDLPGRPAKTHPSQAPRRPKRTKPLPAPSVTPPRPPVVVPKRHSAPERGHRLAAKRSPVPTLSQTGANRSPSPAKQDTPPVTSKPTPVSRQPIIHYVKAGESLWQIAQRYYDQGENWRWIAKANPEAVQQNGGVRVGVRLVIPPGPVSPVGVSVGQKLKPSPSVPRDHRTPSATAAVSQDRLVRSTAPTYTVVADDSLYQIAARTLGDGGRWEEIYEANRDLLDHPDQLQVGQRLKIPR